MWDGVILLGPFPLTLPFTMPLNLDYLRIYISGRMPEGLLHSIRFLIRNKGHIMVLFTLPVWMTVTWTFQTNHASKMIQSGHCEACFDFKECLLQADLWGCASMICCTVHLVWKHHVKKAVGQINYGCLSSNEWNIYMQCRQSTCIWSTYAHGAGCSAMWL